MAFSLLLILIATVTVVMMAGTLSDQRRLNDRRRQLWRALLHAESGIAQVQHWALEPSEYTADPNLWVRVSGESYEEQYPVLAAKLAHGGNPVTRWMAANGGGRIVLISSLNGKVSEPESSHYSAAKAALISLARSMAQDLAASGITANAVAPGWVRTPMTEEYLETTTPDQLARLNPLARVGEAEEIASLIRYLAVEAPPFLTGATLFIDGGQTAIAPMP